MRLGQHQLAGIPLGTYRWLLLRRTLCLSRDLARTHMHVLGKTGSGKSYFLAGLFLALHAAGMPATLIDPHGDLAELVLAHLVAQGRYADPDEYDRLLYLDLPAAARAGRYLPLNFLDQPYDDHAMAELVSDACKRAWPELATGAPTFENILKHSVVALRQNGLPLTALADLLTDAGLRTRLLERVTDPQVVRFFRLRMDAWGRDAPVMKESTLNRADLLTLTPLLRHSLGSAGNALDFRRVLDTPRSVVINLAFPYPDARRLLGCLLTVGMESAALSRANQPPTARGPTHHLLLDEFSQFTAQSEQALTRMLSETRKYGLFVVMAHQNWSQADDRLRGALQNVNVEVIFKTGRMDAEYSARLLGSVNPLEVKHTVANEQAEERTHPTYFTLAEQWERHVQAIQQLPPGHAFVRMPDDRVYRIRTRTLPHLPRRSYDLEVVKQEYLQRYFAPPPSAPSPAAAEIATPAEPPVPPLPAHAPSLAPPRQPIGRRSPGAAQHRATAAGRTFGAPERPRPQTLFVGVDPDADAA